MRKYDEQINYKCKLKYISYKTTIQKLYNNHNICNCYKPAQRKIYIEEIFKSMFNLKRRIL